MLSDLLRWKRSRSAEGPGDAPKPRGEEPILPSKAFPKFLSALSQQPAPAVLLDLGPVIGGNVAFFGEQLGCKLFIEDLYADYDRHARAGTLAELPAIFESRFRHDPGTVDGVLCWDLFDFLEPKAAAPALARQVARLLRPGGAVMGFFTTAAAERAAFTKYEIVEQASLRHRHHPGVGGRKYVLQNRDIIRAFDGLIVSDSFLLKSHTREILLRRKN